MSLGKPIPKCRHAGTLYGCELPDHMSSQSLSASETFGTHWRAGADRLRKQFTEGSNYVYTTSLLTATSLQSMFGWNSSRCQPAKRLAVIGNLALLYLRCHLPRGPECVHATFFAQTTSYNLR